MPDTSLDAEATGGLNDGRLTTQLIILTIIRTIMNTGLRMSYPLLPVFARSVGVDIQALAVALTGGQLVGVFSPIIGSTAEARGRRVVIVMGIGVIGCGCLLVYAWPVFGTLAAAFVVIALGKVAIDPAVQAYLGDRIPYERRGLALGISEFSWAGAFLLGVPAATWLIAHFNWQTPYGVLALCSVISIGVVLFTIDNDSPKQATRFLMVQGIRTALTSRAAVAGLVLGAAMNGANQMINVVFGSWIELSFGVQLAALAAASAVIGASELLGEGSVAGLSDRVGKRRMVMGGLLLNTIICSILPFTGFSLMAALIGLFFFYISYETALVSSLPLATELSPGARAMYMSIYISALALGRAAVTALSTVIFEVNLPSVPMLGNCLFAAVLNVISLIVVWRFIQAE